MLTCLGVHQHQASFASTIESDLPRFEIPLSAPSSSLAISLWGGVGRYRAQSLPLLKSPHSTDIQLQDVTGIKNSTGTKLSNYVITLYISYPYYVIEVF